MSERLAVVVARSRTQSVIDALQERGAYDPDRSVRPYGEGTVAVPVTSVPDDLDALEVVRQVGEPRLRDLEDHLRERGWTDEELADAPGSWAVIGSVVLVDVGDAPRPGEVGEALLAIHGGADTVLAREGIDGPHREPEVEVLAGDGDTETVHTEHGTRYAMDLAEVMFSPGNKAERARMAAVVGGAEGAPAPNGDGAGDADAGGDVDAEAPAARTDADRERVVDMFAGIGYFTLPMARAGAQVTAIERNPTAFRYLLENVRLNGVSDRVQPYRADCRDVLERVDAATDVTADRVVMGHYDAHEYLPSALDALDPGGIVHLHEATPEALVFDRPVDRLETAAAERGRSVEVLDTRRVKGYSEGVAHVVVDARVS